MSHLDDRIIAELVDGELDTAARAAATAHLAACAECRARHAEALACAGESDRLISAVGLPRPLRPLRSVPAPTPSRIPRRIPWRALGWAATVILAVGIGYYAGVPGPGMPMGVEVERGDPTIAAERARPSRQEAPSQDQAAAENAGASPELARLQADSATPAEPAAAPLRLGEHDRSPLPPPPAGALAARAAQSDRAALPQAKAEVAPPAAAMAVNVAGTETAVTLERAITRLGGSIRLIDGMTPVAVRLVAAPEAGEAGATVRVVYLDPPSRELWLDQRRIGTTDAGVHIEPGLLPGDTIGVTLPDGRRSLQWRDAGGFQLFLSGFLPADSLHLLAHRVR